LGCTHYPLLAGVLARAAGRGVELIDSAGETAKAVRSRLYQDGLAAKGASGSVECFSSDDPAKFARLGRRLLGWDLKNVKRIHLDGV
jgi:glutamate racemase